MTEYEQEIKRLKEELHPKGEICPKCEGRGWNKKCVDDVKRYCHNCKGTGKLSHNQ